MEKTSAQMLRAAAARGAQAARRVVAQFQTNDVLTLARRAGVKIVYERWPLVTLGECERRSRTIRVNLNAIECAGHSMHPDEGFLLRAIVAHELGHLFDGERNARQLINSPDDSPANTRRTVSRLSFCKYHAPS